MAGRRIQRWHGRLVGHDRGGEEGDMQLWFINWVCVWKCMKGSIKPKQTPFERLDGRWDKDVRASCYWWTPSSLPSPPLYHQACPCPQYRSVFIIQEKWCWALALWKTLQSTRRRKGLALWPASKHAYSQRSNCTFVCGAGVQERFFFAWLRRILLLPPSPVSQPFAHMRLPQSLPCGSKDQHGGCLSSSLL